MKFLPRISNGVKLIFDFDHTLFSAKKLYFALKETFRKIGVDENLFQETFQKSKGKGRDYNPAKQFKLIVKKKPEISIEKLKREFKEILNQSPKFLYPDTIWFLKRWYNKANLISLSYGEEEFQKLKIRESEIKKYFKKVIITKDIEKSKPFRKVPPLEKERDKKIIFVEDNPTALVKIKKTFKNVITVRINRGEGKYTKEPNNPQIDFSIKNLKELDRILNRIKNWHSFQTVNL